MRQNVCEQEDLSLTTSVSAGLDVGAFLMWFLSSSCGVASRVTCVDVRRVSQKSSSS